MNKPGAFAYWLLAAVFVTNLVSASQIALTHSDRRPFEKRHPAQCARPDVGVVLDNPNASNPKAVEIRLEADFSACVGSQVLVTTYKTGHVYSYGVADITRETHTISISFDKKTGLGSFYQKFPLVQSGRLVPTGPLAPPTSSIDPSEIQVTFAWSWS